MLCSLQVLQLHLHPLAGGLNKEKTCSSQEFPLEVLGLFLPFFLKKKFFFFAAENPQRYLFYTGDHTNSLTVVNITNKVS